MCACVHVLGMETMASHSQARTPAPSLTPVRMLWTHELRPEVLSNRWAENRKGITLRGSRVCQRLACLRVKAKSNFQEAEKGVCLGLAYLLSRGGGSHLVTSRLDVVPRGWSCSALGNQTVEISGHILWLELAAVR